MGSPVGVVLTWPQKIMRMRRVTFLLTTISVLALTSATGFKDAEHITSILGESVILGCRLDFPDGHPVPYIIQWKKQNAHNPLYIWYDGYPPHVSDEYKGRVGRVESFSTYGLASLNLTNIQESDQGWYECSVFFLNRHPATRQNGTWVHLDVHAPPRFTVTPDDIIYVNIGDSIILTCEAVGTPEPEVHWYKESDPIQSSSTVGVFNDGTELRIARLRDEDIGDYVCIAENGEGRAHHASKVIRAGGAVIRVPPKNQTRLEGDKAEFTCEALALPGNVTVTWFRNDVRVEELNWLDTRSNTRKDGTLVINPTSSEDSGLFTCEATNGIGTPQRASAYLEVEFPARVSYTPTVQYLPFRLEGIVRCYIQANPEFQFVTWTKDKRVFDSGTTPGVVMLNNGSLLFQKVNQDHQGRYTCTPYNIHGTSGTSGVMDVLVREPPTFVLRPRNSYQRKIGETIEMPCAAQGQPKPEVIWRKHDGLSLPRNRAKVNEGNLTIKSLQSTDFGYYECVVRNDIATMVTSTQLVVEGTTPHSPYNVSTNTSEFAVTLKWIPGYSGGKDYQQKYAVWYRMAGTAMWTTINVTPSGSTMVTIHNLLPGTTYEFLVASKNYLGDGMFSKIVTATTKVYDYSKLAFPTDSTGSTYVPTLVKPQGPRPNPPRNLTISEVSSGFLLSWLPPIDDPKVSVAYYTIKYRAEGKWKRLTDDKLTETTFLVKNLQGGKVYFFKVFAHSVTSYQSSDELKFSVPEHVKQQAITAALVGGVLFLLVAIILSVCAVKICNKRKRRKQEKAYSMVACRVTEARNGGHLGSPVPSKKFRRRRIPTVIQQILVCIGEPLQLPSKDRILAPRQGFPRARPFSRDVRYSVEMEYSQPLGWISRRADGRFVLDDGSDDGGFGVRGGVESGVYNVRQFQDSPDDGGEFGYHHIPDYPSVHVIYSPDGRRFRASSPGPLADLGPFSFSDLSSVQHPSNAERTFPSTVLSSPELTGEQSALRSIHERYRQELPALQTIHEQLPAGPGPLPPHQQTIVQIHPQPRAFIAPAVPLYYQPTAWAQGRPVMDVGLTESGRHIHFHPVPAGQMGHIQPPRIPDIQQVRLSPGQGQIYQILGHGNIIPSPTQRPLATSSPPRPRVAKVAPSTIRSPTVQSPLPLTIPPEQTESPDSDEPVTYTRDRLQETIGKVRRGRGGGESASSHRHGNTDPTADTTSAGAGGLEVTPESQSSSSGFGSKNTSQRTGHSSSSQQISSSLSREEDSGSIPGTQYYPSPQPVIPAFRAPHVQQQQQQQQQQPHVEPLDASVDDHYEFDTYLTPGLDYPTTGERMTEPHIYSPTQEDMEARVRAMKEEYQEYRQRQALRTRAAEPLESSC